MEKSCKKVERVMKSQMFVECQQRQIHPIKTR